MTRSHETPYALHITGVRTPTDASKTLGVSRATLRRWGLKGKLTSCSIGGKLFYLDIELVKIMYARRKPVEE